MGRNAPSGENAVPLEELPAMMKYLVSHNDAHAQKVADFDRVNTKLDAILSQRMTEEY